MARPANGASVPDPDQLKWEELDTWFTPADNFFVVNHYNQPPLSAADWRLGSPALSTGRRR